MLSSGACGGEDGQTSPLLMMKGVDGEVDDDDGVGGGGSGEIPDEMQFIYDEEDQLPKTPTLSRWK